MLKQSQQQRLLQKLSPQQIQFMKLLQVPTASLEERIKEEMEENPALEYHMDSVDEESSEYDFDQKDEYDTDDIDLINNTSERIDLDNFIKNENDDENGDYYGDNEQYSISPVPIEASFHQYLIEQLQMLDLDEKQQIIGEQIIGSIDSDGYLRREPSALVDDLVFSQNITTTLQEVKRLLHYIQQFDPSGVGAQTLQECLILQLKRQTNYQSAQVQLAIEILNHYFDEFTRKHYDKIIRALNTTPEQFKKAIDCIIKLNPKPGAMFDGSTGAENYIIPDFFITNNNGILEVSLNSKNAPQLRVSKEYKEMLTAYNKGTKKNKKEKEAVTFIKQKLESAKWFIDSIRQRQYTLMQTMNAIVALQPEFFLTGSEATLKPMILRDIAVVTNLDVSTISRVANSKFVQTEFGTFSLKFFFSDGVTMDNGEEVSNREIKSILLDIISQEDKHNPYHDEELMDMLAEKGYRIARRTVAKYREQLLIPVARLRKKA